MKRSIVFVMGMIAVSVVYSANQADKEASPTEPIVCKWRMLAKPMLSVLKKHPDATMIMNCGVACVRVTDSKESFECHYPLSRTGIPKMCRLRDAEDIGFDTCLDGAGRPTKYIDLL